MKALTLWRPWPTLVLHHGKDIENRPWSTTFRGRLLIHGGQHWDPGCVVDAALDHDILLTDNQAAHPTGLLGTVDVVDICAAAVGGSLYDETTCGCGPWAQPGQYHWRLKKPRPFPEPIPCVGQRRLWTPTDDVAALAARQCALRQTA